MRKIQFGKNQESGIFDRPVGWGRFNKTLKNCPIIPHSELSELVIKAKGGCMISKDKVVRGMLRMVVAVSKRYTTRKLAAFDAMDLIQVGCEGVLSAIEKYEARPDCSFPSYAIYHIRGRMLASLNLRDLIRRPMRQELNAPEIEIVSLSTVLEDGIYTEELSDNLPDPTMSLTEQEHNIGAFRIELQRVLLSLSEREAEVFRLFFIGGQSCEDIGGGLDITGQRIRQILGKAILKMQKDNRSKHLLDCYYSFANANSGGFRAYEMDLEQVSKYIDNRWAQKSLWAKFELGMTMLPTKPQPEVKATPPPPEVKPEPQKPREERSVSSKSKRFRSVQQRKPQPSKPIPKPILQSKESLFADLVGKLERKEDRQRYPDSVFWFMGDKFMFEYDEIERILWCNFDIWDDFRQKFNMGYNQIQAFIGGRARLYLNIYMATPRYFVSK